MPKDLLQDLWKTQPPPSNLDTFPVEVPEADTSVDKFLSEINSILEMTVEIEGLTSQLGSKHNEILYAPQQNEKTKREIGELTDSIEGLIAKVHTKLKQMSLSIDEQEAASPASAAVRLLKTQHHTTSRRFMDALNGYRTFQTDYRNACKDQIKLKLEIAERPRTDEEIEDMLESDNPQIFSQGILLDTQQARQNAADIEARHADIMKLEKSITELHGLFLDMATLVESQNELIDRIDYNVSCTKEHVMTAKIATTKAVEYRKKTRKKQIIIGCIVGAVLLLVIAILLGVFIPR